MTTYKIYYWDIKKNKFEIAITTEDIKKAQKILNKYQKNGEAYATYKINQKTWKVYRLI